MRSAARSQLALSRVWRGERWAGKRAAVGGTELSCAELRAAARLGEAQAPLLSDRSWAVGGPAGPVPNCWAAGGGSAVRPGGD